VDRIKKFHIAAKYQAKSGYNVADNKNGFGNPSKKWVCHYLIAQCENYSSENESA